MAKGFTNRDAATMAGIHEDTFYDWMKKFPDFSESIKKTEILRKLTLIGNIFKASETEWQAAAWYLERTYRKEFGRKTRIRSF